MSEKYEKDEAVLDTHVKGDDDHPYPTEEEWKELREVPDAVPFSAFLVILIEFCERFTYYGITGPFQNYIQQPDPGHCKF